MKCVFIYQLQLITSFPLDRVLFSSLDSTNLDIRASVYGTWLIRINRVSVLYIYSVLAHFK